MIKLSKKFWDDLEAKYPSGTDHFYNWVHAYKESVEWTKLFQPAKSGKALSYFDLPIAMQIGVFFQYAADQGRPVMLGRVNSLKDFYRLSAVIENFISGYVPATGPRLDDPGSVFGLTRIVTNLIPDTDGIPDTHDGHRGDFEGGGGEFGGGGASGDWDVESH